MSFCMRLGLKSGGEKAPRPMAWHLNRMTGELKPLAALAASTRARCSPACSPSRAASASACISMPMSMLSTSFIAAAAPMSPRWVTS
jgi:hypothetical protein